MSFYAGLRLVIVVTLLSICIPAAVYFWEMPAEPPPVAEKELANFSDSLKAATPASPKESFSGLDCPVQATVAKQPAVVSVTGSFPPGPIPSAPAAAPVSKPNRRNSFNSGPNVSMIYCEGSIKTAIIDGQVLHEGALLGKNQLVKIEKTRVLLRSAGKDIWLSAE